MSNLIERNYDVADVQMRDGVLVIHADAVSPCGKHYNVVVKQEGNTLTVTGDKPGWGLSLSKGEFDLDKITEKSIEEYRPFIFFGPVKRRSKNMVEYKERTKRTYQSTNWLLIEEPNPYL